MTNKPDSPRQRLEILADDLALEILKVAIAASGIKSTPDPQTLLRASVLLRRLVDIDYIERQRQSKELRTTVDPQLAHLDKLLKQLSYVLEKQLTGPLGDMIGIAAQHLRVTSIAEKNTTFRRTVHSVEQTEIDGDHVPIVLERLEGDVRFLQSVVDHIFELQTRVDRMTPAEQFSLFVGYDDNSKTQTLVSSYAQIGLRELLPYLSKKDTRSIDAQLIAGIASIYRQVSGKNFSAKDRSSRGKNEEERARFRGPSIRFADTLISQLPIKDDFGEGYDRINKIGNAWLSLTRKPRIRTGTSRTGLEAQGNKLRKLMVKQSRRRP